MKSEVDIVFALLRGAIDGTTPKVEPMETHQWWGLFRLLQANHVAALTADTVARLEVPREVKIPWLAERDKAERWHSYQEEVQQEIVDCMQKAGIETLVLKGTRLSQYYPQPELREFGDLDLYFYDKHDEADEVAHRQLKVTVSNQAHHHSKYNYRGVTVESHYDLLNTHYPPSNRRYEARLKKLIGTPTFEVLFLLRHMAGHFAASRITLRDLVDWHLLMKAEKGNVDWDMVAKVVEEGGMTRFMDVLNTIVSQRFDNRQPATGSNLISRVEHDIVFGGDTLRGDEEYDGFSRLAWKLRRYRANRWKQPLVYAHDTRLSLLLSTLFAHAMKPHSILHKM